MFVAAFHSKGVANDERGIVKDSTAMPLVLATSAPTTSANEWAWGVVKLTPLRMLSLAALRGTTNDTNMMVTV